ncbi:sulfite exporter TauE/SafE family protein [Antarcticibacterium arcticum]|uniref:Probable membrane transporter protein n=1 Tax=Antarcticibacterium arcticum TaxID=2585771 RepID=A0A5B8YM64_9FLAO|nr:sulfite exporter TauE/SafE family protein [Antarcticibacterium arcticum]QED39012.1 sulfite exporter TauE/SafE family protein [Antarcticibacterium arcticum]
MNIDILVILGIAIFCGFFVQTLIGFAGSLISLPILLLAVKLPDAIAFISIFYLFSSAFMVHKEWQNIDKTTILRLTLTSVIGVILGIAVLTYSKPVILQTGLGIFILLYVFYVWVGKTELVLGRKTNWAFGVMGGFFSGVFSTGGPLYVISVKNSVQEAKSIRATMIGILALVTLIRIPALSISGVLKLQHLKLSLIILPIFFLAQFLGTKLFPKVNEAQFKKILLFLLTLSD